MPKKEEGKYSHLLKDPTLRRWLRNLERGSPTTAEITLRRLGRACELLAISPDEMVSKAKKDLSKFQDSLEDLVARLEAERKAPGYIQGILKAIKSWLRYNDITLTRRIKISNSTTTPTIGNELKKLREEKHNPQRIVRENELESYLKEGWQFISVLPSQRILIRKG